jgi:hypothetical protein
MENFTGKGLFSVFDQQIFLKNLKQYQIFDNPDLLMIFFLESYPFIRLPALSGHSMSLAPLRLFYL